MEITFLEEVNDQVTTGRYFSAVVNVSDSSCLLAKGKNIAEVIFYII